MEPSTLEMTIEGMAGENIHKVVSNFLFLLNQTRRIGKVTFRCNGDIIDVRLTHTLLDGWTFKQIKYDLNNDGKEIVDE